MIGCVPGNCTLLRTTDHLEKLLRGPPIGVGGKEGSVLITVTEHAREVLRGYERPNGTALRLDPANNGHRPEGLLARLGFGEPKADDQVVVGHEGEELLRIDRSVSEELNGGEIEVISTLEGPSLDIKEPSDTWPLHHDS
jgi:hypothetical protein